MTKVKDMLSVKIPYIGPCYFVGDDPFTKYRMTKNGLVKHAAECTCFYEHRESGDPHLNVCAACEAITTPAGK